MGDRPLQNHLSTIVWYTTSMIRSENNIPSALLFFHFA